MLDDLYDVIIEKDIMVEMRDGVRLATDLYFPARDGIKVEGKFPAVFHRTPYDKSDVERNGGYGRFFARRGYVAVYQDCRGTYRSQGDVNFLVPEAEDGYDALSWIDEQLWSNGKVGSWGTSWSGWTQTAMAALGPKNLAAMVPNMSGADAHEASVRQGGALELRFLAWAFWHSAANTQTRLKADPAVDGALNLGAPSFADWLQRMPIRKGQTQLKLVPAYEKWALELLTRADYDEYWQHPSYAPALFWPAFPDVPTLIIGGWYDSYTRSTCQNYVGLAAQKKGPVRMLMGPWTHGSNMLELSFAGDVEFGEEAALDNFRALHLRYFDRALKGVDNDESSAPPVRIFVMGGGGGYRTSDGRIFHGGHWRDEAEWPLTRARYTAYYLHEGGDLSTGKPVADGGDTVYRFDPAKPVPSIGGNVSSLAEMGPLPPGVPDSTHAPWRARMGQLLEPGGFDQVEAPHFFGCAPPYLPLGSRSDVLVFETAPLVEDVEITGPIEVKLWVSSTAPDTDFTAKLIDLYPPSEWYPHGYALNLNDSIARLRYRNGREKGELLPPGEIALLTITLYPTSNLFGAGHRIRLDISSSNFPRFDVNPNTGDAIGKERRRVGADNTVYHNAARASHIVLPIVPTKKQEKEMQFE